MECALWYPLLGRPPRKRLTGHCLIVYVCVWTCLKVQSSDRHCWNTRQSDVQRIKCTRPADSCWPCNLADRFCAVNFQNSTLLLGFSQRAFMLSWSPCRANFNQLSTHWLANFLEKCAAIIFVTVFGSFGILPNEPLQSWFMNQNMHGVCVCSSWPEY